MTHGTLLATSQRRPSHLRLGVVVLLVLAASLALAPGAALAGGQNDNHCISPVGIDINEFYGTTDAFVTPFCPPVETGATWRPLLRWIVGTTHDVIPPGYVPAGATPAEDFLAKLVSTRYVVDAGTPQERGQVVSPTLLTRIGDIPQGTPGAPPDGPAQFIGWSPRMDPLPPGDHTVDGYITLSAEHWDGLGLDPGNHLPAGESFFGSIPFTVVDPPETTITKAPPKSVVTSSRTVSATFRFRSSELGSTFECRPDGRPWQECSSPETYRVGAPRGKTRSHTFRVRATGEAGHTDPTPAQHRWRVRRY